MSAWNSLWPTPTERPGDEAWVAAVRAELARVPQHVHLPDETWLALARGEPVPDAIDALTHVARCGECRAVLRAVRELHAEAAEVAPTRRAARWTSWQPALAAAAVVAMLGAGWLVRRSSAPQPTSPPSASIASPGTDAAPPLARAPVEPTPGTVRPEWLRATPPAIALYSPGALTMRGAGPATFPDALAEALAPWRARRYRESATRLSAMTLAYPDAIEVPYYLGVARLLAGDAAGAVPPLRRALAGAPASLRPEAAWYLGLALVDSHEPDAAQRAFAEACEAGHARACDAARWPGRLREGS